MPARSLKTSQRRLRNSACRLIAALMAVASPAVAFAQEADTGGVAGNRTCALAQGESGTVADVVDGDTIILTDGRIVRMAGVEAPKAYLARPGADVDPIAEAARQALLRLAGGKRIAPGLGELESDRHGRILAQLYLDDGTWLQEAMVAAGFVRIRPFSGDSSCLDGLRAAERAAREARLGLWREAEFSVISAYDPSLIERNGLYVIVEGRVISVGHGNRVDFLNFGNYWRRDFTVLVGTATSGRLAEIGLPVDLLAGKRVRVRGLIEESGGPAIRLNDPGEIEILDDE